MTTGTEIVEEFHQHTFFFQSISDEWLAKRIDEAIRAAVEAHAQAWSERVAPPVGITKPITVADAPKKQRMNRK